MVVFVAPVFCEDSALCQQVVTNITKVVQLNSQRWCSVAGEAISRPVVDKITLAAVEILMLDLIHFDSREVIVLLKVT